MAKTYWMRFGFGDPRTYTGLGPTFLSFTRDDGTAIASPTITEVAVGTGIYKFSFGATQPIAFLADAATTTPGPQGRYVVGSIDAADRTDEYGNTLLAYSTTLTFTQPNGLTLVALGTTAVALGITAVAIGTTSIAFGTTQAAVGTTTLFVVNQLQTSGVTITVAVGGIGSTTSVFGDANNDPGDLFGYLKRILENLEGNQSFIKPSGSLSIYSRGSSTLLRTKTIANSVSTVIKT